MAPEKRYTRRQVLGTMGGSAAWLALGARFPKLASYRLAALPGTLARGPGAEPGRGPTPTTNPLLGPPPLTLTAALYRRDDMLMLQFYCYNLVLSTANGSPSLTRATELQPAYVVVAFPPQALLEAAVPVGAAPPPTWPAPPLPAMLSGPSQLAFFVPSSMSEVPFTVEALLTWARLTPQWESAPFTGLSSLPELATYIEAPARLMLSPDSTATWHHATSPLTYDGRTELWQTRLGANGVEPPVSAPPLRAVWTPGFPDGLPDAFAPTYSTALLNSDRLDIIALTCGTSGSTTGAVVLPSLPSIPARADLFMLTALGASLNVHGAWSSPGVISLTDWRHRTAIGRDSYVRTVRAGFLFPFGHRAVFITITDREFQVDGNGDVIAYLVQRQYVVVVQPERDYAASTGEPYSGRKNPLRQVTVTTLATPPLDPSTAPSHVGPFPVSGDDAVFWVRANNADYPFGFAATDLEGRTAHFNMAAIFVSEPVAVDAQKTEKVNAAYAASGASRRSTALSGQLLAFAAPGGKPGSTAQHVDLLELAAEDSQGQPGALEPNFFPVLDNAMVRLPGAEQLAGSSLGSTAATISANYFEDNFKAGAPEIYLELAQNGSPVPLGFSPQTSGGIATPNLGVTGLARDLGPVAGSLTDLLSGKFDPKSFFTPGTNQEVAKLLGAVSLADIVAPVGNGGGGAGATVRGQAPTIQSSLVYPGNDASRPPEALQTTLDWSPEIQGDALGFFVPGNRARLQVHARIYTPITNTGQTTYSIEGNLADFHLVLFGQASPCIDLAFDRIRFSSATGAKTQLVPDISGVTFIGPLRFVQAFKEFFSSLGGPTVSAGASGVQASYSAAIPSISLGAFSLSNLALSGVLNIPFDSSPVRLRVDFCTRDNPFLLAIDLFSGGGFFGVALGADGIEMLEASLEFGASVSIDLGVASGGVSIMAGIYFALQTAPSKEVQLTGFLKADGNLSVLGIVSISIEFYLGFTYLDPGQAYGTATVTVEVSVLCFSKSVSMTMQRTISGSDPKFSAAMTESDWEEYCLAFAA